MENKKNSYIVVIILSLLFGLVGGFAGNYVYDLTYRKEAKEEHTEIQTKDNNVQLVSSTKEISSLKEGIQKAYDSVVEITVTTEVQTFFNQVYEAPASGSGVIISDDGYIITNNHVVKDAKTIKVKLYNGKEYDAELIGADSKTDIAVVKIEENRLPAVQCSSSDTIEVGDDVFVIGNPLGYGISVSEGIISATTKDITVENEILTVTQTTAAVNGGNSGGGLFNIAGEMIGVINAKSSGTNVEGMGYAIPISDALTTALDIIDYGYVKNRATLGVSIREISNDYFYENGVYIANLIKGGAAETAGIKIGDRLISYNDEEIDSYARLSYYLKGSSVGDTIKLVVKRDDKELTYNVTLTENSNTSEYVKQ